MRLPDRPDSSAPPGEPSADHPDAALRVERDWQALTERLLRLPDAHPSSPRRGDRAGRGEAEEIRAQDGQYDAEPRGDEARPGNAEPDQDGELAEPEAGLGPGAEDATDRGRRKAGPAAAGWPAGGRGKAGDSAGAGRDPYRPWFAGAGGSEPWFTAGPDGRAARPEGTTGPAG